MSGLVFDEVIHTTLAFVHTDKDGDRSFSFYRNPGADVMLTENEVLGDLIESSKIFHFGTLSMTHETSKNATRKALKIAKEIWQWKNCHVNEYYQLHRYDAG